MVNGKPTKAGLLVDLKIKEKTDKGIYLPESKQTAEGIVQVLATGPLVKEIKVGDWIQASEGYKPKAITIEGKVYGLIQEFEVDWIFENPPKDVKEDIPVIKQEDYLKRIAKEKREANLKYDIIN